MGSLPWTAILTLVLVGSGSAAQFVIRGSLAELGVGSLVLGSHPRPDAPPHVEMWDGFAVRLEIASLGVGASWNAWDVALGTKLADVVMPPAAIIGSYGGYTNAYGMPALPVYVWSRYRPDCDEEFDGFLPGNRWEITGFAGFQRNFVHVGVGATWRLACFPLGCELTWCSLPGENPDHVIWTDVLGARLVVGVGGWLHIGGTHGH